MSAETMTYRVRTCCSGGPLSHRQIMEPAGPLRDTVPIEWSGEVVKEMERPEVPRYEHVAYHEAGHCVVAIGLGARVAGAQIDGSPLALIHRAGLSWQANVLIDEAGEIAQNWRVQWHDSPSDKELREHAEAIRELSFGPCDRCRTFLQLVSKVGTEAPTEKYIYCYRDLESKVIEIIRRQNIWRAISELADELMERGIVEGERVHEIIERHVAFGSIEI